MITRKQFLVGAGLGLFAIGRAKAARKTTIRLGLDLPNDHPTTLNANEAAKKIKAASNDEVEVLVFPNNQLGDDTHMLSNLRSGAMQMMAIG
ncbi:MAG: TRAP transporter substrate-binding protein, partial [Acidisphaera sp.]|nr:TRAP transporter substrate-binding protein [Acidisphaera sp.]